MGKKEKKAVRKGKRQRKGRKHESLKQHKYYKTESGSVTRIKKSCPRCGTGTWLAEHKGRLYCGRCAYTEFLRKPEAAPEKPKEVKKPEARPEKKPEAPEEKKEPEEE